MIKQGCTTCGKRVAPFVAFSSPLGKRRMGHPPIPKSSFHNRNPGAILHYYAGGMLYSVEFQQHTGLGNAAVLIKHSGECENRTRSIPQGEEERERAALCWLCSEARSTRLFLSFSYHPTTATLLCCSRGRDGKQVRQLITQQTLPFLLLCSHSRWLL